MNRLQKLQAENDQLRLENARTVARQEQVQRELEALRSQLEMERLLRPATHEPKEPEPPPKKPGYWVLTSNPTFRGETMGVTFFDGQAFLPESKEGKRLAGKLVEEFNYCVVWVEDWQGYAKRPDLRRVIPLYPKPPTAREEALSAFSSDWK